MVKEKPVARERGDQHEQHKNLLFLKKSLRHLKVAKLCVEFSPNRTKIRELQMYKIN